jgi:hypothetical protein
LLEAYGDFLVAGRLGAKNAPISRTVLRGVAVKSVSYRLVVADDRQGDEPTLLQRLTGRQSHSGGALAKASLRCPLHH